MPSPDPQRERSYNGDMMAEGRAAEVAALEFLKSSKAVLRVKDVRNDPAFQDIDVDFVTRRVGGEIRYVEAKSDTYMGVSGNVLFELMRINHTAPTDKAFVMGWSARSGAHQFIIYSPRLDELYVILADNLRRAAQQYTQAARKHSRLIWIDTDQIKSTLNLLIPIRYVPHRCYVRVDGVWRLKAKES